MSVSVWAFCVISPPDADGHRHLQVCLHTGLDDGMDQAHALVAVASSAVPGSEVREFKAPPAVAEWVQVLYWRAQQEQEQP